VSLLKLDVTMTFIYQIKPLSMQTDLQALISSFVAPMYALESALKTRGAEPEMKTVRARGGEMLIDDEPHQHRTVVQHVNKPGCCCPPASTLEAA